MQNVVVLAPQINAVLLFALAAAIPLQGNSDDRVWFHSWGQIKRAWSRVRTGDCGVTNSRTTWRPEP
jgi:hypothetical protein